MRAEPRQVQVDIQASGNLDALRLLIESAELNSLPDDFMVKVTIGFMRGIAAYIDAAPKDSGGAR